MGFLFPSASAAPAAPPPPAPLPGASAPTYASGATLSSYTRPAAKPWSGTDLGSGPKIAQIGQPLTASMGLTSTAAPGGAMVTTKG